jgi:hypothetical protein
MMQNPISELLDAAKREADEIHGNLENLKRQYEIVRARQEAYEIASKAFENASPKIVSKRMKPAGKTRNRLASSEWREVFTALHLFSDSDQFDYEEIFQAATRASINVKRPSLRTKMMNYVNDGHVVRVGTGKFSITPQGMAYFKIGETSPKENEPLKGNPASGSEAGTDSTPFHSINL